MPLYLEKQQMYPFLLHWKMCDFRVCEGARFPLIYLNVILLCKRKIYLVFSLSCHGLKQTIIGRQFCAFWLYFFFPGLLTRKKYFRSGCLSLYPRTNENGKKVVNWRISLLHATFLFTLKVYWKKSFKFFDVVKYIFTDNSELKHRCIYQIVI